MQQLIAEKSLSALKENMEQKFDLCLKIMLKANGKEITELHQNQRNGRHLKKQLKDRLADECSVRKSDFEDVTKGVMESLGEKIEDIELLRSEMEKLAREELLDWKEGLTEVIDGLLGQFDESQSSSRIVRREELSELEEQIEQGRDQYRELVEKYLQLVNIFNSTQERTIRYYRKLVNEYERLNMEHVRQLTSFVNWKERRDSIKQLKEEVREKLRGYQKNRLNLSEYGETQEDHEDIEM